MIGSLASLRSPHSNFLSKLVFEFDQGASVLMAIGIGLVFYFISLGVGKSIAKNVPRDKRRKVATEGIIPFIFMLLTFMIIIFTVLHQSILT